jgi:hypothetical protein
VKLHTIEIPTDIEILEERIAWCQENIGEPFAKSDETNFVGFNYKEGLWGCYQGYNRFQVGYNSPDLKDNWVFKNERDRNWFAMRWS